MWKKIYVQIYFEEMWKKLRTREQRREDDGQAGSGKAEADPFSLFVIQIQTRDHTISVCGIIASERKVHLMSIVLNLSVFLNFNFGKEDF